MLLADSHSDFSQEWVASDRGSQHTAALVEYITRTDISTPSSQWLDGGSLFYKYPNGSMVVLDNYDRLFIDGN